MDGWKSASVRTPTDLATSGGLISAKPTSFSPNLTASSLEQGHPRLPRITLVRSEQQREAMGIVTYWSRLQGDAHSSDRADDTLRD